MWADDTLKTIAQIHRMGPPASPPPSASGYLAGDHAGNMGQTLADWSINFQIYAAELNQSGTYYADAARYPQGGIYNPPGNTDPANSYIVYQAPNFLNPDQTAVVWGGYAHGSVKWGAQGDSVKVLDWYSPPPQRYIPDGFTLTHKGKSFMLDVQYNQSTVIYDNALLFGDGTWNAANHVFDYTYTSIPLVANTDITRPRTPRIAADPTGNILWIAAIDDNNEAIKIDSAYLYPVLFKSTDGGVTWSDAIPVQLYGPTGINTIKNFVPQNKLDSLYDPPTAPPRDEISYTTWTNLDLVVDKWGNPHMAVAVGVGGSTSYSFVTADSCWGIFDVFSPDGGVTFCARLLGSPKQFEGLFPDATLPEQNRPNAAINETGDHVFFSWLDTRIPSSTANDAPDIMFRGWNLLTNMLTNANGKDAETNVTFLSEVTQAAYCGDMPHYVFTKPDGSHIVPFMCESQAASTFDMNNPVTFKYIPDFNVTSSAYTIAASGPAWGTSCEAPVGIDNHVTASTMTASIFPNPVKSTATVRVSVPVKGAITIQLTNLVGQTVMNLTRNVETTDTFTLDASQLNSGVYFYTVKQGSQKVTGKIIVE